MENKTNKEEQLMEEVTLENIEVLEETLTPTFGFDCGPHGFGIGCY